MRADVEDDGLARHQSRDDRGQLLMMLPGRGLEEMGDGAAGEPPAIRLDLSGREALGSAHRSGEDLPLNPLVDGLDSHR